MWHFSSHGNNSPPSFSEAYISEGIVRPIKANDSITALQLRDSVSRSVPSRSKITALMVATSLPIAARMKQSDLSVVRFSCLFQQMERGEVLDAGTHPQPQRQRQDKSVARAVFA